MMRTLGWMWIMACLILLTCTEARAEDAAPASNALPSSPEAAAAWQKIEDVLKTTQGMVDEAQVHQIFDTERQNCLKLGDQYPDTAEGFQSYMTYIQLTYELDRADEALALAEKCMLHYPKTTQDYEALMFSAAFGCHLKQDYDAEQRYLQGILDISANEEYKEYARQQLDDMKAKEHLRPGHTAPDIEFTDAQGNAFKLSAQQGKVVLLDFWATWCPPCRKKLPEIAKLSEQFKDNPNVVFVGLALERDLSKDDFLKFVDEQGLSRVRMFYDLTDEGKDTVCLPYAVSSIPFMVLIDKQGKIVQLEPELSTVAAEIEKLLAAE